MDIKKLITGTIVGGILFFLLGWLVYGMLLQDFMKHNPGEIGLIGRKEENFTFLIAGQVLQGLLLTYILIKANVSSLDGGLIMGAVTGLLLAAAIDCTIYGTTIIMSKKGIAADVIASTAIWAITGAVIGAVAGGKNK